MKQTKISSWHYILFMANVFYIIFTMNILREMIATP